MSLKEVLEGSYASITSNLIPVLEFEYRLNRNQRL